MAEQLSFEAYQSRRHILGLDGLRALSILGVLLHHTRGKPFYVLHGYRGVWIFFVISGFLITTLALREEARAGYLDIKAFMIRRVFRILPLYYLALLLYIGWGFGLGMEAHLDRFQEHMLNFVLYTPEIPIFRYEFAIPMSMTWSLGIEEKFYLVWPLLSFGLLAKSRYRIWVTLALIACGMVLMLNAGWLAQMWGSYVDILVGCLLAQLLHNKATYDRISFLGRTEVAWAIMAVLLIATTRNLLGNQLGERVFTLVSAAAVGAIVTNKRGPADVASLPWIVKMGTWSYAIYLLHGIAVGISNHVLPPGRFFDVASLGVMLLITLPVCWLVHEYFEQPLIRLGRRLSARPSPAVQPTAPASTGDA